MAAKMAFHNPKIGHNDVTHYITCITLTLYLQIGLFVSVKEMSLLKIKKPQWDVQNIKMVAKMAAKCLLISSSLLAYNTHLFKFLYLQMDYS